MGISTINWSPTTSAFENKTSGTIICGSPGSGKSFFMLNVAANQLIMGQKVIYIDPKNDAFSLLNVIPNIDIIDVNHLNEGSLNPFTVLKNCDVNAIMTIIECICGKLSDKQRTAITPIVKDFIIRKNRDKEYVDFKMLTNYLYANDSEEARVIGTNLKATEDSKYGKLLFTNKRDIQPINMDSDRPLIISLHGMVLPSYTKKANEYNADERFTSAIVYLLCNILNETLTNEKKKVPVNLIIDEAHVLFGNSEMTKIIERFLSLGRSLNVATILASQGVTHFPENISNYCSTKIMFRVSNLEAEKFLHMFDNSSTSGNALDRDSIMNFITNVTEPGQMFILDSRNRGGFGQVVSNFKDHSVLTSNPLQKKRKDQG